MGIVHDVDSVMNFNFLLLVIRLTKTLFLSFLAAPPKLVLQLSPYMTTVLIKDLMTEKYDVFFRVQVISLNFYQYWY